MHFFKLMFKLIFFYALLLQITSCTVSESTSIKPLSQLNIPLYQLKMSLDHIDNPLTVSQLVTFKFGERQDSLPFILELSKQQMVMSAIASWGSPLFVLTYDGKKIDYIQAPIIETGLKPEYILTDLFLTFWPINSLNDTLAELGYNVEDKDNIRKIFNNDQLIIEIIYQGQLSSETLRWQNSVEFIQHQLDYQLSIQPLDTK